MLESESLEAAREKINAALGSCDILVNGAGGNSPLGTTTKDTLELEDIAHKAEGVKTFFDLDPKGIEFVSISTSSARCSPHSASQRT